MCKFSLLYSYFVCCTCPAKDYNKRLRLPKIFSQNLRLPNYKGFVLVSH